MLIVRNDEIHISKGDDASIELTFSLNGEPYELQEGDKVVFAAKKDDTVVLTKELTTNNLVFAAADTANLDCGSYLYDLKMKYANGTTTALIAPSLFRIMEVV